MVSVLDPVVSKKSLLLLLRGRRQQMVIFGGAEVGEVGLRVALGDVADAQVPCGGRVRPVGARAGAAGAQ
eukprot:4286261-Prymnesium_polylepis.1